ncbi:unnamed protein product [Phytophthora fragariaefolia]|uniref:Unnamed protein product n=1 Tax=Phytophthora fragariaefolia TaxID=1490495 RepID=A0A9W6UC19_9STRA|nr:unnamed protein product [Phytophthora fragariaefolia]
METLQKNSSADKAAAAGASDEVAQVQRIAEAKERRLQNDLNLSEATRHELENQIKELVGQIGEMKEEQRRSEEIYSDQRALQRESERLKRDLQVLQHEHNDLKSRYDETSDSSSDLHQKISLLTADKTFLQEAKSQLEEQLAKLKLSQQEMQARLSSLQEKHDGNLSQNVQLQNETRLHFEKKLDDEMTKFMELSKREIERIRNDGQVVYERENRLLKEARDDALKHAEVLQARLDSVQSTLDEKRNKLKEYELLEVDLDGAVIQTGEIAARGADRNGDSEATDAKLQEVMSTFGAIPTTTKRRVRCDPVVQNESQNLRLAWSRPVPAECAACPESGAVRRYEEVQSQLQQLRAQYRQVQDANSSLQSQLQQLLSRRGDLDALKTTVQLLRDRIHATNHQKRFTPEKYQGQSLQANESSKAPTVKDGAGSCMADPIAPPPISSFAKVSPPPSIASKMTQPPTPLHQKDNASVGRPALKDNNAKNVNIALEQPTEHSSSAITFTHRRSLSPTPPSSSHWPKPPSPNGDAMASRLSRPLLRSGRATVLRVPGTSSGPRSFANAARGPDEALKADFKRWLKKEAVLLAFVVAAGATGVHFYQTLGKGTPATKYYLDALEHNSRELKPAKRERNRVVTLDRIAQSYEDRYVRITCNGLAGHRESNNNCICVRGLATTTGRGHGRTAERYFKQAISTYDQNRGRRELSKASKVDAADLAALDREIPAVLFNYSQLLMANERWGEAGAVLQRARTLARTSTVTAEHLKLIEAAIDRVRAVKAAEKAAAEQQQEQE